MQKTTNEKATVRGRNPVRLETDGRSFNGVDIGSVRRYVNLFGSNANRFKDNYLTALGGHSVSDKANPNWWKPIDSPLTYPVTLAIAMRRLKDMSHMYGSNPCGPGTRDALREFNKLATAMAKAITSNEHDEAIVLAALVGPRWLIDTNRTTERSLSAYVSDRDCLLTKEIWRMVSKTMEVLPLGLANGICLDAVNSADCADDTISGKYMRRVLSVAMNNENDRCWIISQCSIARDIWQLYINEPAMKAMDISRQQYGALFELFGSRGENVGDAACGLFTPFRIDRVEANAAGRLAQSGELQVKKCREIIEQSRDDLMFDCATFCKSVNRLPVFSATAAEIIDCFKRMNALAITLAVQAGAIGDLHHVRKEDSCTYELFYELAHQLLPYGETKPEDVYNILVKQGQKLIAL